MNDVPTDTANDRPNRRITRRRAVMVGLAGIAGVATAGRVGALAGIGINTGASATEPAVRLRQPAGGGFDPTALYVALYGHPGSSTLGSLGEQGVDAAVRRAELVASTYAGLGRKVVASFEIIATVASSSAGGDGDYSNEFPASKFQPWIDAAARAGMHVVLDLQPGRATFPSQTAEIEGLLAHPHVSLALDPEWRVGPTQRPGGGRIGTVDGAEINETIEVLDDIVRRNGLPRKMLVVHQFTSSMVTSKSSVSSGSANVQVLFQMDGFGTLQMKQNSFAAMTADLPSGVLTGWKNFYDEDAPTPTPAQSLAVDPTPSYISYQ